MKRTILVISLLGLALSACSKPTHEASQDIQSTAQTQAAEQHEAATPSVDSDHNAQNSLDWAGTYKGVLPCADCTGINTTLTLNPDHTYQYSEQYQVKDAEKTESKGSFSFDSTGSIVTLDGNANQQKLFVGENYLEIRNAKTGEKIDSALGEEYYRLTKESEGQNSNQ